MSAVKNRRTMLIPSFTLAGVMRRADARRVTVPISYIWIRRARQRFARQCPRTRNCSRFSVIGCRICAACSCAGTAPKLTLRTTVPPWVSRPPCTALERWGKSKAMVREMLLEQLARLLMQVHQELYIGMDNQVICFHPQPIMQLLFIT